MSCYYLSILKKIDKYIKNNHIDILNNGKIIVFNYRLLDSYLDLAITNKMREKFEIDFSGCVEYSLEYDENDNLCLLASSDDDMHTLIIYDSLSCIKPSFSNRLYTYWSEKKIIEDAAMLKYLEESRLKKRNNLLSSGYLENRVQLERKYIDSFASFIFKIYEKEKDVLVKLSGYDDDYNKTGSNIIRYMVYACRKNNRSNQIVENCYNIYHNGKKLVRVPNGDTRRIMGIVKK